jgi:pseudo-response regulator 7
MGHDLEMATRRSACDGNEIDGQAEGVRRQEGDDAACVMQDDGPSPCGGNGESPSPSGPNGAAEESSPEAIDLINGIACQPQAQAAEQPEESEIGDEELDQRGRSSPKATSGSDSGPMLELSLKRPRSAVDNEGDLEERQPLRHSGGSAFSRCAFDASVRAESLVAV